MTPLSSMHVTPLMEPACPHRHPFPLDFSRAVARESSAPFPAPSQPTVLGAGLSAPFTDENTEHEGLTASQQV